MPPIKGYRQDTNSISSKEDRTAGANISQLSRKSSKPKIKPPLPDYDSPLRRDKNKEFLVKEIYKNQNKHKMAKLEALKFKM